MVQRNKQMEERIMFLRASSTSRLRPTNRSDSLRRGAFSHCLANPPHGLSPPLTIFHEYCNQSSRICEIRMSCHSRMKDDARQRRWYQPTGSKKSCLLSTDSLITPLHSLLHTRAPLQRLRPSRFAFIPTERVCHLSRSRRAGMKIGTDSS